MSEEELELFKKQREEMGLVRETLFVLRKLLDVQDQRITNLENKLLRHEPGSRS